ncbi:MAG: O-antigen ligase family protein [Candidatus Hodarchaeota archaeon]
MQSVSSTELQGNTHKGWLISIVMSIVVASVLVFASSQEKKWLLAGMLGIIGIFGCCVLQRKLWQLLLLLIVFVIPLRIDFYLLYKPTYFVQTHGVPGLPVSSFDILLIPLSFYLCLKALRGGEKIDFYPSISIPALAYLVLSGISAFHSADRPLSFAVLVLMIKSYVAFLFFANRIKTRADLSLAVFGLIVGVLLQSFVGTLQYVSGGSFLKGVFGVPEAAFKMQVQGEFILSRVGGTIGHPNSLAKYLSFCIPVLITYSFVRVNPHRLDPYVRKLALVTAMVGAVTLLLTMSRGSWVALGLTFMFLFYEAFRRFLKSRAKAMVAVLLLNAVLAGAALTIFEDVRIRLFEDDYNRAQARLPMAMVALNVIKHQPIKGVGLNNYTRVMYLYDRTREWQTYKFPHPVHNSFLLIAAESGVPALIAFLCLIGGVFTKAWSALRRLDSPVALLQVGWMGGLMTWLIAGMFDRDFAGTNVMLWFTMAAIVATSRILSAEKEMDKAYETESARHWA